MLAAGDSYSEICERIGCSDRYVSLWKDRFQRERLSGLDSRYHGAEHRRRTAETEARILELTRRGPTELRELGAQAVMDDLSLFTGTPANCDEVIWKESV
jgi:transposase